MVDGCGMEQATHEPSASRRGVRAVALLEAAKGALALLAALGLVWAVHEGAARLFDELAGHLHLNPAKGTPRVLAAWAQDLTSTRLQLLSAGVLAYAAIRAVECWGLWHGRRWAEWFSVASGAVYLPFELYELAQGVSVLKLCTLLANVVVVAYMASVLRAQRRARAGG